MTCWRLSYVYSTRTNARHLEEEAVVTGKAWGAR